jgi:flagellar hook-basal body protein
VHQGWSMAAYMGIRATRELDLISHNLANASTGGFKRELLNTWRLKVPEDPLGWTPPALYVDVRSRDFAQGSLHETGSETDLAIQGPGYFKVETPRGVRYTRSGSFHLNPENKLVTKEGYPVLGKNGPLTLDSRDQAYSFDERGGRPSGQKPVATRSWWWISPIPRTSGLGARPIMVPGPQAGEEMEAKQARLHARQH